MKLFVLASILLASCGAKSPSCPNTGGGCPPCKCDCSKPKEPEKFDYSTWDWPAETERDLMPAEESKDGEKILAALASTTERQLNIARDDVYYSVPWARSAPCAVTMSAVLEFAFDRAGLYKERDIFTRHANFGVTIHIEKMLYRMGWDYWPLSRFEPMAGGVGLEDNREDWLDWKLVSGHIYFVSAVENGVILISDNARYRKPYHADTEGIWLPRGVVPKARER